MVLFGAVFPSPASHLPPIPMREIFSSPPPSILIYLLIHALFL